MPAIDRRGLLRRFQRPTVKIEMLPEIRAPLCKVFGYVLGDIERTRHRVTDGRQGAEAELRGIVRPVQETAFSEFQRRRIGEFCQPLHRQRIRFRRQRGLIFRQSYQKHLPVREQCGNEKQLRFFRLIRYRKLHQKYRKQRQFYNQINIFDKESKS